MKENWQETIFPRIGSLGPKSRIVVLTGAGISQESGISTFRDSGGLWEQYDIYEVATPEAWHRNPHMVLGFYNARRRQLLSVEPNEAHLYLSRLAEKYDVEIITQNIDDLHERAGSGKVMHLHGELRKARSSVDDNLIYDIEGWELKAGQCCAKGAQLRPHVVWFGEMVPMMQPAEKLVQKADLLLVIGTSLAVYPAAGLLYEVRADVPVVVIDPGELDLSTYRNVHHIREKASVAVKNLVLKMLANT